MGVNHTGWKVQCRRRREHEAKVFPRMRDLWREGRSHAEIATQVNADHAANEGPPSYPGTPWTEDTVRRILKDRMDPEEHAEIVKRNSQRGRDTYGVAAKFANLKAVKRAKELEKDGLSLTRIAKQLAAEDILNAREEPYGAHYLGQLLRDSRTQKARKKYGTSERRQAALEREDAIFPIVMDLVEEGLSPNQISRRLKSWDDPKISTGATSRTFVARLLRDRLPEAKFKAIVSRWPQVMVAAKQCIMKEHYTEEIMPRVWTLWQNGVDDKEIAEDLFKKGYQNTQNRRITPQTLQQLRTRFPTTSGGRLQPIVFGAVGAPVQVLSLDGNYHEMSLGVGVDAATRWRVIKLLYDKRPNGASTDELKTVSAGWRELVKRLMVDERWAAIIYPAKKSNRLGWRIGPPRRINTNT